MSSSSSIGGGEGGLIGDGFDAADGSGFDAMSVTGRRSGSTVTSELGPLSTLGLTFFFFFFFGFSSTLSLAEMDLNYNQRHHSPTRISSPPWPSSPLPSVLRLQAAYSCYLRR